MRRPDRRGRRAPGRGRPAGPPGAAAVRVPRAQPRPAGTARRAGRRGVGRPPAGLARRRAGRAAHARAAGAGARRGLGPRAPAARAARCGSISTRRAAAAAEAEEALAAGDPRRAAERARAALERFERPLLPELDRALGRRAARRARRAALRRAGDAGPRGAAAGRRRAAGRRPRGADADPARAVPRVRLRGADGAAGGARQPRRGAAGLRPAARAAARRARRDPGAPRHRAARPAADAGRGAAPASPTAPGLPLPAVLATREERPFVGRTAELAALRQAWELGQGAIVVVAGEAGMGKTRLAARFAAEAHAGGAAVLHGRIDEETVVPYQPFVEALRHYVAHAPPVTGVDLEALAPLVPELGGVAAESGERENRRYRLFEAVAALLGRVAAERPLLLVVEDLQWAGMPTLLLLRHVVRRLEGAPLLVLVTMRDEEANLVADPARLLADLSREHVVERIALGGLEEADAAELVGDPELARRLHGRTAGNPFFIEEMLRSLAEAPEADRRARGRQGPRLAPPRAARAGDASRR